MKSILVLGGTRFIGRVFIEKIIKDQLPYQITLFNRGKTNEDLFPDLNKIVGDRETDDIEQLGQQDWDYVVDFSGYFPNSLARLLEILKGRVGRYIYTSTISVYDMDQIPPDEMAKEDAARLKCSPQMREHKSDFQFYGQQKAACEEELEAADWLDKVILRPSVVFGRYDYLDRHYYWLYRAKMGAETIIPTPEEYSNYTFVEDYAELVLQAMQTKTHRIHYNATTHAPHSFSDLMHWAADYWGKEANLLEANTNSLALYDVLGGRQNISLWFQHPLRFDYSKALEDFELNYTDAKIAIHKTIEYYNEIHGDDWPQGIYGWRTDQEKALIYRHLR
jgi:2'-hydroxyisoflavone reductase